MRDPPPIRRARAAIARARPVAAGTRRPGSGGFTLVELVAVIAVIGIVATVGAMRFASPSPFAGQAAADQLAATVRQAHRLAVAQRRQIQVRIEAQPAAVAVALCGDSTCSAATPLPAPDGEAWYAPRQAPRLSASVTYTVDPMGRPSFDTAVEIRPSDADGQTIGPAVRIEPESGLVRLRP